MDKLLGILVLLTPAPLSALVVLVVLFALAPVSLSYGAPADASSRRPVRIVALGDSTTAVYDWAPQVKRVYAECLPQTMAAHGIHVEVANAGIGDTTTAQAVARLEHDVRAYKPDLVVVQFGINDSWIDADEGKRLPRLTRAQYRNNLRTIVATLRHDGAQVVLMTPNPMRWLDPYYIKVFQEHPGLLDTRAPRGIDKLLEVYAQDLRDVAHAEGVPLVDIFDAFEAFGTKPGQSINQILLEGDGIHPNQAGQNLVCKLLTDKFIELMAPPS